nr:hypothetical protein [Xanthomonas euvesicatoria]
MDAVIAALPVIVGCVMVYFSAISLYTWPQTGQILFRSRAGCALASGPVDVWGALRGLRRERAASDVGKRLNLWPARTIDVGSHRR